jgi:undecaprenyl-diphosphatase
MQGFTQRMCCDLLADSPGIASKTATFLHPRHEIGVVEAESGERVAMAALTRADRRPAGPGHRPGDRRGRTCGIRGDTPVMSRAISTFGRPGHTCGAGYDAAVSPASQTVRVASQRALLLVRALHTRVGGALGAVVALIVAVGAWAFLELSDDVAEGDTARFDAWVAALLREGEGARPGGRPVGPDWLLTAAIDLTALGGATVLFLVVVVTAAFFALRRDYRAMLLVLLCTALGQVINSGLKAWFSRERPESHLHLVEVTTASFPSGHAMMSAVTYLTLGAVLSSMATQRRVKVFVFAVAVLLSVLVGFTRVYLGVHHVTDVFAGWAAGLTWALACWLLAYWLQSQGVLRPFRTRGGPGPRASRGSRASRPTTRIPADS